MGDRIVETMRLFDFATETASSWIAAQHPDWTADQVDAECRRRGRRVCNRHAERDYIRPVKRMVTPPPLADRTALSRMVAALRSLAIR